jgi:predicted transglutaminase-like cysteine proteinase
VSAALILVGLGIFGIGDVAARPERPDDARDLPRPAGSIHAGRPAFAPFAYLRFCQRSPRDCTPDGQDQPLDLTPARLKELASVNEAVNQRIAPKAGLSEAGAWSLTARQGNCNTYALQKRHELLARGWPIGALSLAVVVTPEGVGHLVLVVRHASADLVLDNLHPDIRPWTQTDYHWTKIQAAGNPDTWLEVPASARRVALGYAR